MTSSHQLQPCKLQGCRHLKETPGAGIIHRKVNKDVRVPPTNYIHPSVGVFDYREAEMRGIVGFDALRRNKEI